MSEPRFYVQEFKGYPISTSGRRLTARYERISFYVFDRLYNHATVRTYEATPKGRPLRQRLRRAAEAECDRLNAWWQEELARG